MAKAVVVTLGFELEVRYIEMTSGPSAGHWTVRKVHQSHMGARRSAITC